MYLNEFPSSQGQAGRGRFTPPKPPVTGVYLNKLAACRRALVELDRSDREVDRTKAAHLAFFATRKPPFGGQGGNGHV